jgi:hypothetical protein
MRWIESRTSERKRGSANLIGLIEAEKDEQEGLA